MTNMEWKGIAVSRCVGDDDRTHAAATAFDPDQPALLLSSSRLRALGLAVGSVVFLRRPFSPPSREDAHGVASANDKQAHPVPAIVHALTHALRTHVRRPHGAAADDAEEDVCATAALLAHFTPAAVSNAAQDKPNDPAAADHSLLSTPLALEMCVAHPRTNSVPVAQHLLLRIRGGRGATLLAPSFDLLASLLPSVLHGRIVSVGSRIRTDALHVPIELEVVEARALPSGDNNNLEQIDSPCALLLTRTTALSLESPLLRAPPTAASLLAPVAFPSSVDAWMSRVSQHVFGYRSQLTSWLADMWHTVRQYEDEVTAHYSVDAMGAGAVMTCASSHLSAYTPRTFLLHGLSGSGKSHVARILGGTSGLPHFLVHASSLLQRREGASESGLVRVFQAARDLRRPCLLILDEIDTVLPRRRADDAATPGDDDEGEGVEGASVSTHDAGWRLGNARVEWRMAAVLKELLDEANGAGGDQDLDLHTIDSTPPLPTPPTPPIFVIFTTSAPGALDVCGMRGAPYVDQEIELKSLRAEERLEALEMTMKRFRFVEEEEDEEQTAEETTRSSGVVASPPASGGRRRRLLARVAAELHGFVGADIDGFTREVLLTALQRCRRQGRRVDDDAGSLVLTPTEVRVCAEDLDLVSTSFRPANLQQLEFRLPPAPDTSATTAGATRDTSHPDDAPLPLSAFASHFASLAGIDEQLARLHHSFLLPIKQPSLYRSSWRRTLGMQASRGVLIYGAPGTGKTALSVCLARACGLNVLVVSPMSLISKALGASEANLARLFAQARASAPSLLVFDQIEMIAPARKGLVLGDNAEDDEDETQTHDADAYERILSVLLIEMDGVLANEEHEQVYVVATSTRPDLIDPALLRPSRLDAHVHLGAPDQASRYAILRQTMRDTPLRIEVDEQGRVLVPRAFSLVWAQLPTELRERLVEWDWDQPPPVVDNNNKTTDADDSALRELFLLLLSHACVHFSGADLVTLQRESALHALRGDLTSIHVRSWSDLCVGALRHARGSLTGVIERHPFGRTATREWATGLAATTTQTGRAIFSRRRQEEVTTSSRRSDAHSTSSSSTRTGTAAHAAPLASPAPHTAPATTPFVFSPPAPVAVATDAAAAPFAFDFDSAAGTAATPITFSMGTTVTESAATPPPTTTTRDRDARRTPMRER